MIKPSILIKGPFNRANVNVSYNPVSNRKKDPELEKKVEAMWIKMQNEAKKNGKLIYNGGSYRLNGYEIKNGKLMIEVSKFKYSTRRPIREFEDKLERLGPDYYSKGLATGGYIKTADDWYVFGIRSGKTMENNSEDFIGGVLDAIDLSKMHIFDHNNSEIKEELNISMSSIKDVSLLGLVSTGTCNIIMVLFSNLTLTKKDVRDCFTKEGNIEMRDLRFVRAHELEKYMYSLGGYKPEAFRLAKEVGLFY